MAVYTLMHWSRHTVPVQSHIKNVHDFSIIIIKVWIKGLCVTVCWNIQVLISVLLATCEPLQSTSDTLLTLKKKKKKKKKIPNPFSEDRRIHQLFRYFFHLFFPSSAILNLWCNISKWQKRQMTTISCNGGQGFRRPPPGDWDMALHPTRLKKCLVS